jgi:hypothetical protein
MHRARGQSLPLGGFRKEDAFLKRRVMIMQKWLRSNRTGLVAAAALAVALVAALFVTIAQVRCSLLEEDMARLKGRLMEEVETFKAEQETNHKAVLGVVNETVRRVAQIQEARATPETAGAETPKEEPGGGVE